MFSLLERELNFQQLNPFNTSHHTFNMLPRHLAKVRSSNFGKSDTVRLLEQATPASVPSNSPDLNSVDYKIGLWGVVWQRVYVSRGSTALMNWSSVCCMFGMTLTRTSLTMQLMSGVSVIARRYERTLRSTNTTIVTIFSYMTRDVSVFVKYDTIFILFFFVNYHKFDLRNFAR